MKRILLAFIFGLFLFNGIGGTAVFAQTNQAGPSFSPEELFPSWGKENAPKVEGVIGDNADQKLFMNYIPNLINIALKFVSPLILIVLLIAGVRMIIAGDDTDAVENSKNVIRLCVVGVIIILLSYSLVRTTYFFFADEEKDPDSSNSNQEESETPNPSVGPSAEASINSAYDSIISTLNGKPKDATNGNCIQVSDEVKSLLQEQFDDAVIIEQEGVQMTKETQDKKREAEALLESICDTPRGDALVQGNDPVANVRAAQAKVAGLASDLATPEQLDAARQELFDAEKALGEAVGTFEQDVMNRLDGIIDILNNRPKGSDGCLMANAQEKEVINAARQGVDDYITQNRSLYDYMNETGNLGRIAFKEDEVSRLYDLLCEEEGGEAPSAKAETGGFPPIPTSDDPVERVQLLEQALSDFQSSGEPTYAGSRGGTHLRDLMIELNAARELLEVEKSSLENSLGLFYRNSINLLEEKESDGCITITPEDQTKLDKDEQSRSNRRTNNASVYALIKDSITLGAMEATLDELLEKVCSTEEIDQADKDNVKNILIQNYDNLIAEMDKEDRTGPDGCILITTEQSELLSEALGLVDQYKKENISVYNSIISEAGNELSQKEAEWEAKLGEVCKEKIEVIKLGEHYSQDHEKTYYSGIEIVGADRESFKVISDEFGYSKDDTSVYYLDVKISGALPESFVNEYGYATDESSAYFWGKRISSANLASFEVLNPLYAKDNINAYFRGNQIEGVDINTFEATSIMFAKDKNHSYVGASARD